MNDLRCSKSGHEISFHAFHRVKINQHRAQNQGREDNQSRFGTERAAGPNFGTVNLNPNQWVNAQARNGKSENDTLKEIPADMQANGEPELLGADIPISKI